MKGLTVSLLVPTGKALLIGGFAVTLVHAMRGLYSLSIPFERLVIGMLALSLYGTAASELESVSNHLTAMIAEAGRGEDLKTFLLGAIRDAAAAPMATGAHTSLNVPALIEQAWRTGVWGIMTALVEGVFLVISFVLECARDVLWQLLLFLFPLAAGVYPVFPRMMTNFAVYAVELSLWIPMLYLVEGMTGAVARTHVTEIGTLGLSILGVELVAIALILTIPAVTHRFLSGALNGDLGAQGSAWASMRKVANIGQSWKAGGGT